MAPYSQDLRDRVLAAVKTGKKSQAELAETFGVSLSTIEKWWHRWRTTGQSTPQPYRAGPPRTLAECDDLIRSLLAEQPDLTLDELCTHVAEQRGVIASRSMTPAPNRRCGVCRTVQRLNLPLKKVAPRQRTGYATSERFAPDLHRAGYADLGDGPA